MKLFVDEDTGIGIAKALIASGIESVDYVGDDRDIKRGTYDTDWLPHVGRHGYLVLSRNKEMLRVEAERKLIIAHGVGIVFLPGQNVKSPELVRLVLGKLDWLEQIDRTVQRPFAFTIYRTGQTAQRELRP